VQRAALAAAWHRADAAIATPRRPEQIDVDARADDDGDDGDHPPAAVAAPTAPTPADAALSLAGSVAERVAATQREWTGTEGVAWAFASTPAELATPWTAAAGPTAILHYEPGPATLARAAASEAALAVTSMTPMAAVVAWANGTSPVADTPLPVLRYSPSPRAPLPPPHAPSAAAPRPPPRPSAQLHVPATPAPPPPRPGTAAAIAAAATAATPDFQGLPSAQLRVRAACPEKLHAHLSGH
jgi:hypothetical protein